MLEVQTHPQKHRLEQMFRLSKGEADAEAEKEAAEAIAAVRESGRAPGRRISAEELAAAAESVPQEFRAALSLARVALRRLHEAGRGADSVHGDGESLRVTRRVRPIRRAGVLCGASFMSLLLHAVPAQVAGVGGIAVAAAPEENGAPPQKVLAAARSLGLEEVYLMTGASAVAAMAFGAAPLPGRPGCPGRVDKIVGSDSPAAAAAKRMLSRLVGTDGGAGRGELVVVADGSANARLVAGELLAQAEHGEEGPLMLLTDDRVLAESVRIELGRLASGLPNGKNLLGVLDACGALCLFPGLDAAVDAANAVAPARLSLQTMDNDRYLPGIETAGAVFVGPWTPELPGLLPAGGTARFNSGPGPGAFLRETVVVEYSPDRLARAGKHLALLAEEEGRPARAASIRARLELFQPAG